MARSKTTSEGGEPGGRGSSRTLDGDAPPEEEEKEEGGTRMAHTGKGVVVANGGLSSPPSSEAVAEDE